MCLFVPKELLNRHCYHLQYSLSWVLGNFILAVGTTTLPREMAPRKNYHHPQQKNLLLIFLTNLKLKIGEGWAGVKFIPPPPKVPLEASWGGGRSR